MPFTGVDLLVLLYVLGEIPTALTNRDPIAMPGMPPSPGVSLYDAGSVMVSRALSLCVPFLLGRVLFHSPEHLRLLLRALAIAALVYSPLVLLELRLSPQLHAWVYGFFPHSFDQTVRGVGWRPQVFMAHGLMLSIFLASAVVATAGLYAARKQSGRITGPLTLYLLSILIACKSMAAGVYGVVGSILLLLARPKATLRTCLFLAAIALFYPPLRGAGLFPTDALVELAARFSADRARSLEFRFRNEDLLMDHAAERFLFGWGSYGRNIVMDPQMGRPATTDGAWVITYGSRGAVAYFVLFGAFVTPIFLLHRRAKWLRGSDLVVVVATGLVVVINVMDLLPNAFSLRFMPVVAGALAGVVETLRRPRSPLPAQGPRQDDVPPSFSASRARRMSARRGS
jgi:hypothetical protein